MNRPVHFEIHAENPDRAMAFYAAMFAWQFNKVPAPFDYWLIMTGAPASPGINGGLMKRMGPPPAEGQAVNAFVCTVEVENLDQSLAKLAGAGGHAVLPKMAVGGVGWLAYVKDTEGNILGMMQMDPGAK